EHRLPWPSDLRPLVEALDAALRSEDRATTQEASRGLIHGLCAAMDLPPVQVEVLAARPHARWGELHGLYTNERGKPPKIQLWMRTAKQKRVVAFRTFLRTLLHEVGHHVDYTGLRLKDSFHTEGFYKRESSLFHQLVEPSSPERRTGVATMEDYAKQPLAFCRTLTPEQWKRGGTHAARGRITLDDFVAVMAGHDDNHLDQLTRALEGRA